MMDERERRTVGRIPLWIGGIVLGLVAIFLAIGALSGGRGGQTVESIAASCERNFGRDGPTRVLQCGNEIMARAIVDDDRRRQADAARGSR